MARPPNRDKVLAAALAVFEEVGLERFTLDRVASEAKMSKGGILYHFRDRDALIAAIAITVAGDQAPQLTILALNIKPAELDKIWMIQLARMVLPTDSPGYPKTTEEQAG